jgi:hypothetical protein
MRTSSLISVLLVAAGCADAEPRDPGGDGGFTREVRGGVLHRTAPAVDVAALAGASVDPAALDRVLALDELAAAAGPLRAADLARTSTATTSTIAGDRLVHVAAVQQVGGIPVHGTYLHLTLRDAPGGGTLVASDHHVYHGARVDTAVRLDRDAAIHAARGALRADRDRPARGAELEVWPLDGGLALVWVVDLDDVERRALVRANGPRRGEVTLHDARVFDADGVVRGHVAVGGAPGGAGQAQLLPLRELQVTAGDASAWTDDAGGFALAVPAGSPVTARLFGAGADVRDAGGADAVATAPAAAAMALTLGGASEAALGQGTAYHGVAAVRAFLVDHGIPEAALGAPLITRVNLPQTCNAYFHPVERSINFFRAGSGCRNSAEASIIAHEYGHFVDHTFGGITDGGLSEGWGDVLACLSLGAPVVGGDLLPGDILRTCDNAYQFPPSGHDGPHALGQAWSGFVWHAREALIAELGLAEADALIRGLVLPSLVSNAADIPAAVREVFLRDDDDGDLGNLTPHWSALRSAAERHGLGFVLDGDLDRPGPVTDLTATAVGPTTVRLRWTAPGDDGATGTAAAYDLRIADAPISEDSFWLATPLPAPDPVPGGITQEATITVAPGETIRYVALRAVDEAGNQSVLSNVARVEPARVAVVFADGAEQGLGAWQATGLWHVTDRRAATGSRAFWFGDEATGDYGGSTRRHGVLASPVVDLAGHDGPALVWSEYLHVEDDPAYDLTTITVRDVDDPAIAVSAGKLGGWTDGRFVARALDLGALTGRRVRIELGFDTVDDWHNATDGWFVDDIRIVAASEPTAPDRGGLVINEVLADPPPGWDSGGDGIASTRDDEMIELVNAGDAPLDLSGWTLADAIRTRLTFPAGATIAPGGALVVLGGGAAAIDGVPVVIAPAGLYLNNDGDVVRVRTPDGAVAAEVSWGDNGGRDSSLVRQLDGDATSPMVRHVEVAGTPASPGRRSDGTPWRAGPSPARLVINEILADPPVGWDGSGDGHASVTGDEFIEVINVGGAAIELGGVTVSDTFGVRVTIPDGVVIGPGEVLLVFGGGAGLSLPGVTVVPSEGLGLSNDGDTVTLARADGSVLATASYGIDGGFDQSLVRSIEGVDTAPLVRHLTVASAPASPGLRVDGSPF